MSVCTLSLYLCRSNHCVATFYKWPFKRVIGCWMACTHQYWFLNNVQGRCFCNNSVNNNRNSHNSDSGILSNPSMPGPCICDVQSSQWLVVTKIINEIILKKNNVAGWCESCVKLTTEAQWSRVSYHFSEEKNSLWQVVQGQLDRHMQKNKFRPLLHNIFKNLLKMDPRPKCKSYNFKMLRRKHGVKLSGLKLDIAFFFFFWHAPNSTRNKRKKKDKLAFFRILLQRSPSRKWKDDLHKGRR